MKPIIEDTARSWIKRYTASDGRLWIIDSGYQPPIPIRSCDVQASPDDDEEVIVYGGTVEACIEEIETWTEEN